MDLRFIYDDWNLLGEIDEADLLQRSYIWGLDLSGSEQGAGGVGGLVAMKLHTGAKAGTYFAVMDGNGNLMGLVNAANGITRAEYAYGPFGEPLRATGLLATDNPFRFSTKYFDTNSFLLYYGHRFYSPSLGRWLSRDPIGEVADNATYSFLHNNGVNFVDVLGLYNSAGHFYTTYLVARAAGHSDTEAFAYAYWS